MKQSWPNDAAREITLARKQLYERYAGQLMASVFVILVTERRHKMFLHDGLFEYFRSFDKFTYKGEWVTQSMACACDGK